MMMVEHNLDPRRLAIICLWRQRSPQGRRTMSALHIRFWLVFLQINVYLRTLTLSFGISLDLSTCYILLVLQTRLTFDTIAECGRKYQPPLWRFIFSAFFSFETFLPKWSPSSIQFCDLPNFYLQHQTALIFLHVRKLYLKWTKFLRTLFFSFFRVLKHSMANHFQNLISSADNKTTMKFIPSKIGIEVVHDEYANYFIEMHPETKCCVIQLRINENSSLYISFSLYVAYQVQTFSKKRAYTNTQAQTI